MYDIEFVIPFSLKGKYLQRLRDFKKIGLQNIKNQKVAITILLGNELKTKNGSNAELNTEAIEEIKKGWDDSIAIRIDQSGEDNPASKIYSHLSKRTLDSIDSRWICKFDDDSVNDVDSMVAKLDQDFDCERDYYIMAERRCEEHDIDRNIAINHGFNHWFTTSQRVWHEKEGSIISAGCMKKILQSETAVSMLKSRGKINEGWGDIMLAYAARAVKIYPDDAYFLSSAPDIGDFTLLEGNIAHIHFVAHDLNTTAFEIINQIKTKTPEKLRDKEFLLRKTNGEPYQIIQFKNNHKIKALPGSKNESLWYLSEENKLIILDHLGEQKWSFNMDDEKWKNEEVELTQI